MHLSKELVLCVATVTAIGCFFGVKGELNRLDRMNARLEVARAILTMPAMRMVSVDPDDVEPIKAALEVSYLPPAPKRAEVPMAIKLSPVQDLIVAEEVVEAPARESQIAAEDAIRMALRQKKPMLEYCFDQELRKQAAFNGTLLIKLSVAVDGSITAVSVEEGNRRDRAVAPCIVAQLRTLKLPPLAEEAELLLPIRLHAIAPVFPELHAEADLPAGS